MLRYSCYISLGTELLLLKDLKKNLAIKPMPYRKTLIASMVTMVGTSAVLYVTINDAFNYLPDVFEAPPVQN